MDLGAVKAKLAADYKPGDLVMVFGGQAEGALENGSRIQKTNSAPTDTFKDGALGTVISSVEVPSEAGVPAKFFYGVIWDEKPEIPIHIFDFRIRPVE